MMRRALVPLLILLLVCLLSQRQVSLATSAVPLPFKLEFKPLKYEPPECIVGTLDKGITYILCEDHSLPIVDLTIFWRAPLANEPDGKWGIGNLTTEILAEGGGTKINRSDFRNLLDGKGAFLTSAQNRDFATFTLKCLSKDFPHLFDALTSALLNPAFPDEELTRLKREDTDFLKRSLDSPGAIMSMTFDSRIFGQDHPYGRPVSGRLSTLESVTLDDVRAYYERFFTPERLTIAVGGDFDPDQITSYIGSTFGSLEKSSGRDRVFRNPKNRDDTRRVFLVNKEINQANIAVGRPGFPRNTKNYFSLILMNYLLGGGGFASRLSERVRNNEGLAYSVGSRFAFYRESGYFQIFTQTKLETAGKALSSIFDESKRYFADSVNTGALDDAKWNLIGRFPAELQTPGMMANYVATTLLYSLPDDYLETYIENVLKVSPADREKFTPMMPEELKLIVVVGPADKLKGELVKFGEVEIIELESLIK